MLRLGHQRQRDHSLENLIQDCRWRHPKAHSIDHMRRLHPPIYTTYTDVETTLLAHTGDLQITLICSRCDADAARQRVDELASRIVETLEDWLYSSEGDSLEQIVLYYLGLRQATLAVAESCTGAWLPSASRAYPAPRGRSSVARLPIPMRSKPHWPAFPRS